MTAQMGNTQNLYLLMEAITLVTMNGWCILRLPTKKQTKKMLYEMFRISSIY